MPSKLSIAAALGQPSPWANLRHATHGVIWTVSDSSGIGFSTRCQVVTLG